MDFHIRLTIGGQFHERPRDIITVCFFGRYVYSGSYIVTSDADSASQWDDAAHVLSEE
jgi:hypothetical protein